MQTEIRWLVSASTSGFHAAAAIDQGRDLTDPSLAEILAEPVAEVRRRIESVGLLPNDFWRHVVPMSAHIDGNQQLAEVVLRKTATPSQQSQLRVDLLADSITKIEQAVQSTYPDLVDQLELRGRPLRDQWGARGPGLMTLIGQKTDPQLIVSHAEVVLIHPVLGGGGQAHLQFNSATIEAVLTNTHDDLPEVVRLAWMLAQLNNDLPMHSETIHRECLALISNLAMLPAALTAAQDLGLAYYDPQTVRRAVDAWHIAGPEGLDLSEIILHWWDEYCGSRPRWGVALTALSQMVGVELAALGR